MCKHTLDALPFALTAFYFDTSQKYNKLVELECLLIGRAIVDLDWLIFIPSDCSRYGQANIFSNMTQTDRQTDIQTRATSRDASASKKGGLQVLCPARHLPRESPAQPHSYVKTCLKVIILK